MRSWRFLSCSANTRRFITSPPYSFSQKDQRIYPRRSNSRFNQLLTRFPSFCSFTGPCRTLDFLYRLEFLSPISSISSLSFSQEARNKIPSLKHYLLSTIDQIPELSFFHWSRPHPRFFIQVGVPVAGTNAHLPYLSLRKPRIKFLRTNIQLSQLDQIPELSPFHRPMPPPPNFLNRFRFL